MPTIKQMEAVYWVHSLGGFHAAAARLNTTQSTISKRIHEIEADLGGALFDRTSSGPKLTLRGRTLIEGFAEILALRSRLMTIAKGQTGFAGRLRLGVTELVSLSFLPLLVEAIRAQHPRIILELEIDLSRRLHDRLAARRLDLVIGPRIALEEEPATLPLGQLECAWFCAPELDAMNEPLGPEPLGMEALSRLPLLLQPEGSAIQLLLMRDLAGQGPPAPVAASAILGSQMSGVLTCNSLAALAGLAAAGLGVTYGPVEFFAPLLRQGKLRILAVEPPLPPLEFIVAWHRQGPGGLPDQVAELARQAFLRHRAGAAAAGR